MELIAPSDLMTLRTAHDTHRQGKNLTDLHRKARDGRLRTIKPGRDWLTTAKWIEES